MAHMRHKLHHCRSNWYGLRQVYTPMTLAVQICYCCLNFTMSFPAVLMRQRSFFPLEHLRFSTLHVKVSNESISHASLAINAVFYHQSCVIKLRCVCHPSVNDRCRCSIKDDQHCWLKIINCNSQLPTAIRSYFIIRIIHAHIYELERDETLAG